jgi:hypothetical protein
VITSSKGKPAQIWRIGVGRGAHLLGCGWVGNFWAGLWVSAWEAMVTFCGGSCGDAAGTELGSSFVERITANVGKCAFE